MKEMTKANDRKAKGMDGINTKLWKYGGIILQLRLLDNSTNAGAKKNAREMAKAYRDLSLKKNKIK